MTKLLLLHKLKVANFRSVKEREFALRDFCVLIGKNNCGKSNILDAVAVLLEGTARSVEEADYWDKTKPIVLEGEFENVGKYLGLCSSDKSRKAVGDMLGADGLLRLRRSYGPGVEKPGGLVAVDAQTGADSPLKTGIDAELKRLLPEVIYIKALADVSDEASGKTSATLGKLLGQILANLQDKAQPELDKAFATAKRLLNVVDGQDGRVQDLRDVEADITALLRETFVGTSVRLNVELPDVKRLLADVAIDVDDGQLTPFYRKGHGLQRALYLSLIRALAKRVRSSQQATLLRPFILLFEEPELFLHPSSQEQMRDALAQVSQHNQVAIATHTPSMVSVETFSQLVLVRRIRDPQPASVAKPGFVTVSVPPVGGEEPTPDEKDLLNILNLHRASRVFFFSRVLLVEGPSDVHLLNAMALQLGFGSLEAMDCTVVEIGGKAKLPLFQSILGSLGIDAFVLADLDFLWNGAGSSYLKSDPDLSRFCQVLPKAEAGKEEKESKLRCAAVSQSAELQKEVALLVQKLIPHRVFVLSHGTIEDYAGMSDSGKGKYIEAAREICQGTRQVNHVDEIRTILNGFVGRC